MGGTFVNSRTGFQPVGEASRTGFQPVPSASALPPPASRLQPLRGFPLLRPILGLILLLAAGLKAQQLATDPLVTLAPRPSSLAPLFHSRPFLIAVVECELLFGLVLLSGIFGKGDRSNLPERPDQPPVGARCFAQIGPVPFSEPRVIWLLSLLCFGGFALISLYKGISGDATCGCFGRVPVNPWYTFTLDAAVVLALLRWRPRGLPHSHSHTFSRSATILAVWLLVGTPVALATWTQPVGTLTDLGELLPDGKTIFLKPETWVGKGFALAGHIDVGKRFLEGVWLVLLYHHTCPACRDAVAQYRGLAVEFSNRSGSPAVALVECPPYGEIEGAAGEARWTQGYLDQEKTWRVSTPVALLVHDGKVQGLFENPRDIELVRTIWGNGGQP